MSKELKAFDFISDKLSGLEHYEQIEVNVSMHTILKALKRNEPMKPEPIGVQFVEWGTNKNMGKDIRHLCPKCTHTVDNHYCSGCGQKIDWGEK